MAAPMERGSGPAGGGVRTGEDEQESPRPEPAFVYTERDFIRSGVGWSGSGSGSGSGSRLDRALLSAWARRLAAGCFRYPLRGPELPSRELPGPRHLLAQLNARRASERRPPQTILDLRQPLDPQRFNFSQVPAREILFPLRRGGGTEARVGGQPGPEAPARPEAQVQPNPGGLSDRRPLSEAQDQTHAGARTNPGALPEAQTPSGGQSDPGAPDQAHAGALPETQTQAGGQSDPGAPDQAHAGALHETQTQAGGQSDPGAPDQTHAGARTNPGALPETQTQAGGQSDPGAPDQTHAGALHEAQTQAGGQSDPGVPDQAHAGAQTDPEGQSQASAQLEALDHSWAQPDPEGQAGPLPEAEPDALLIINVSPLEQGHVLLLPEPQKLLPQTLTRAAVLRALELVLLSSDPAFRVGFNSLGAFASVNHLHLHGFYLRHRLEVEWASTEPLGVTGAGARVHRLCGHYTQALVLYSDGGDLEEVADTLLAITHLLLDRSVAHNLLLTRGCGLGPRPPDPDCRDGVRLILWPRRSCFGAKDSSAFNVAFCELAGFLPVKTAPDFETLTEESALRIIGEHLLPAEEFQQLGAEIAGLALH